MSEPMAMPSTGESVAEACADALLTACAHVIFLAKPELEEASVLEVVELAMSMIDRVLIKSQEQGARP